MDKSNERMAILETKFERIENEFQQHMHFEKQYIINQSALLQEIREEQAKMKGFWGGVVFVFSALATAFGMLLNRLFGE